MIRPAAQAEFNAQYVHPVDCPFCMTPLFFGEELCRACWESDVADFEDMIRLGLIGFHTPRVTIQWQH